MRENRGVPVKVCKAIGAGTPFFFPLIILFDRPDKAQHQ